MPVADLSTGQCCKYNRRWRQTWHAAVCGGRYLSTRNELRLFPGPDSYALLYLLAAPICEVTRSIVTRVRILAHPPPQKKMAAPKRLKFGSNFGKLRNLIANISRTKQNIVRMENGVANRNLSCACELNMVNFGPQTAKNKTGFSTELTRSRCVGHVP